MMDDKQEENYDTRATIHAGHGQFFQIIMTNAKPFIYQTGDTLGNL